MILAVRLLAVRLLAVWLLTIFTTWLITGRSILYNNYFLFMFLYYFTIKLNVTFPMNFPILSFATHVDVSTENCRECSMTSGMSNAPFFWGWKTISPFLGYFLLWKNKKNEHEIFIFLDFSKQIHEFIFVVINYWY